MYLKLGNYNQKQKSALHASVLFEMYFATLSRVFLSIPNWQSVYEFL